MFAVGEGRVRWVGLLAKILAVALLFCHGFFGGLHLVSGPSGIAPPADGGFVGSIAGGHAQHGGVGSLAGQGDPQDPASHWGTTDYAAVLMAAFAAGLALLLGASLRNRSSLAATPQHGGIAPIAEVPVLARGPDRRVLLQVLRL